MKINMTISLSKWPCKFSKWQYDEFGVPYDSFMVTPHPQCRWDDEAKNCVGNILLGSYYGGRYCVKELCSERERKEAAVLRDTMLRDIVWRNTVWGAALWGDVVLIITVLRITVAREWCRGGGGNFGPCCVECCCVRGCSVGDCDVMDCCGSRF